MKDQIKKPPPVTLSVGDLLGGKRYAWIRHGSETYLLQITKANKLLLTK